MSYQPKAQALSYDFFIGVTMFIIALTIILFYWNYTSKQIDEAVANNDIANKLFLATQPWFREGYPIRWSPPDVIEIGLTNDGYLNNTKISSLITVGYGKMLELIGVQSYNIYYRVYNESNYTYFEFGIYPSDADDIARLDRLSVMNSMPVVIRTLVWR